MSIRSSTIALILIPQLAWGASTVDHLLPVDLGENANYRAIIMAKLAKTPFDCGRVIVRPTFDSEISISIYRSRKKTDTASYFLTFISAQHSLWDASDGGRLPRRASPVSTRRVDRAISETLARQLRDAFSAVLSETRGLAIGEKPKRVVIEGPTTEFSIPRADGRVARGEISYFPATGPKLKRLEALTLDLLAYCKASPVTRHTLARKIERNASALSQASSKH